MADAARRLKPVEDAPEVVWEDPPKNWKGGARGKWHPVLEPLMARPGEWARIKTYANASTVSSAAKYLRTSGSPSGRWEFAGRALNPERSQFGLYARYLGPEEAA